MGWLSGWKYRKSITLSRVSGSVTNYQMKLLVGESAGATGEDVDCDAKVLSSFDDLRFTTSDGTTLLDYWIESITGSTPNQLATVWIEFNSIGTGATSFYMYFGKSDASAYSNGVNTFPFFDDFSAGSIDTAKWNIVGSPAQASGEISLDENDQVYGKASFGVNYAVRARSKADEQDISFVEWWSDTNNRCDIDNSDAVYPDDFDRIVLNHVKNSAAAPTYVDAAEDFRNTYAIYEIFRNSTTGIVSTKYGASGTYTDNFTTTDNIYTGDMYPSLRKWNSSQASTLICDWILIRQKLATEPAWGSWGALEILGEISESATISASMTPLHLVDVVSENASISDLMKGSDTRGTIAETASISDLMKGSDLYGAVPETSNINDEFARTYEVQRTEAESATISDAYGGITYIDKTISESLTLADSAERAFPETINELIFVWEALAHGWNITNNESLVLTDTLSEVLGVMISDWITLVDSQTNNWNGRDIINDTVYLYDVVDKYLKVSDTISEGITLTDVSSYVLTVAVLEYLGFTSLASAMKSMADTLNEGIALADSPSHAWQELISETLQAVDTISVITTFVDVVSDTLTATDATSMIARIGASLNESLVFTETISSKGTLYSAVYDTLRMNVTVELSGEVYECYVLNTPKFMPSMYSGFNFNSYCVFENRAFGANDTGIYELTGTTDAGSAIHDGVILSETDFGSRNQKRFRRAYLGISGSSPVMVVETGEGERQVYNIDTNGKAVVSRELKSKEWKLSVADFDELDTMKLIPVILSK
jgi:hypothetical protein